MPLLLDKSSILPGLLACFCGATLPLLAGVTVERVPENGVQPKMAVDAAGNVHVVYLTGNPGASNVRYARRAAGAADWEKPVTVNSIADTAVAIGTVRGAQLALGRNGAVHVVWNGATRQKPPPPNGAPLYYARTAGPGAAFEPQRSLSGKTAFLDGGAAVAADAAGRVFVVWHAAPEGKRGEQNRAVFLALSTDDGRSFAAEREISPDGAGACACCGLQAWAASAGGVFVAYRKATAPDQRGLSLLRSDDHGARFREIFQDPWQIAACPMSTAAFAPETDHSTARAAAWETSGRVKAAVFAKNDAKPGILPLETPTGSRHPSTAVNSRHETLVAWAEGTGWQRGGRLAWQLFDAAGKPAAEHGSRSDLPVWNSPCAVALGENFLILY